MLLNDMIKEAYEDGKSKGKAESILELLDDFGDIPKDLTDSIMEIEDQNIMTLLLKKAKKAESIEQFISEKNAICSKKREAVMRSV